MLFIVQYTSELTVYRQPLQLVLRQFCGAVHKGQNVTSPHDVRMSRRMTACSRFRSSAGASPTTSLRRTRASTVRRHASIGRQESRASQRCSLA